MALMDYVQNAVEKVMPRKGLGRPSRGAAQFQDDVRLILLCLLFHPSPTLVLVSLGRVNHIFDLHILRKSRSLIRLSCGDNCRRRASRLLRRAQHRVIASCVSAYLCYE